MSTTPTESKGTLQKIKVRAACLRGGGLWPRAPVAGAQAGNPRHRAALPAGRPDARQLHPQGHVHHRLPLRQPARLCEWRGAGPSVLAAPSSMGGGQAARHWRGHSLLLTVRRARRHARHGAAPQQPARTGCSRQSWRRPCHCPACCPACCAAAGAQWGPCCGMLTLTSCAACPPGSPAKTACRPTASPAAGARGSSRKQRIVQRSGGGLLVTHHAHAPLHAARQAPRRCPAHSPPPPPPPPPRLQDPSFDAVPTTGQTDQFSPLHNQAGNLGTGELAGLGVVQLWAGSLAHSWQLHSCAWGCARPCTAAAVPCRTSLSARPLPRQHTAHRHLTLPHPIMMCPPPAVQTALARTRTTRLLVATLLATPSLALASTAPPAPTSTTP